MFERLKWATRALAAPAEAQRALYPAFVACADQLALDYGEALYLSMRSPEARRLRGPGRELLLKIDDYLNQMSGPARAELWTDAALEAAGEWRAVRTIAATALELLDWPSSPPPPSTDCFLEGAAHSHRTRY